MDKTVFNMLSDDSLLSAFKSGDVEAFEEIYNRFWRKLFLLAYKKLHSKEVAEELTQTIFVSLWERRTEIEIIGLENYLFSAIKYKIIDYIDAIIVKDKIFNNIRNSDIQYANSDAEATIAVKEIREAIDKALEVLPEKTQTIFKLSRFEHFTIKEIAFKMNMNEKAVEYHITQSLKTMRIHLKDFILTASVIIIINQL